MGCPIRYGHRRIYVFRRCQHCSDRDPNNLAEFAIEEAYKDDNDLVAKWKRDLCLFNFE